MTERLQELEAAQRAAEENLKKYREEDERQKQEQAQVAIRNRNVDTILQGVAEEQRGDVALMMVGMHQQGLIDLDNQAEDAGIKLREKLQADRPGWFKPPANAGPAGPPGSAGAGLPKGPILGLPLEQQAALSDEQWKAHFERLSQQPKGPVRL